MNNAEFSQKALNENEKNVNMHTIDYNLFPERGTPHESE